MEDTHSAITAEQRDAWLRMSDAALLADCQVDAYRASGPGGQKRNKTSSAVRLRHKPSGLSAISEESRSQHANKRNALRRLRLAIAVDLRCPPAEPSPLRALFGPCVMSNGRLRVSPKKPEFPLLMAHVLDGVVAAGGSVREAAQAVGVSTSQLVRFIASDHSAFARVNGIRAQSELPRLRMH